jgi:CBS domain containing-hemolysin-like protein
MHLQTLLLIALALLSPSGAHASLLSGEALDKAADVLALVVLFVVPLGVLYVFWMLHILPEKIAERRHHPQKDAIHALCLLSLFFGGLLWPIAWLWAYSKPVGYKLAYGTDKHEDYYSEEGEALIRRKAAPHEIAPFRKELDAMEARGTLSKELRAIRAQLRALEGNDELPQLRERVG